jgi:D-inositol-3-phosphate glycosyltransferase
MFSKTYEVAKVREERLRIAMLSLHSNPIGKLGTKDTGGMSVYIRELAHELGKRGYRIDIYTRLQNDDYQHIIQLYENVRLIHLSIPNYGKLSKVALYPHLATFFQALDKFRTAENLEYDIIHSHYWLSGRLGSLAQTQWNRPHFVTFHTLGALKNRSAVGLHEPDFRIAAERELVQTCYRVLAPTEREKQNLIRYYAADADKIGIVPCGVNLNLFCPADKTAARKKLGFEPQGTMLLYVGRFDPLKGLDTLLEAMPYLRHQLRLRLVIVGGDGDQAPEFKKLQQKIRELAIGDRVMLAGQIEQQNLPPYYSAADVLVMPSHYESFGLVGLEALACGRPVVSTPVGAAEDLIRNGRTGRIVADATPRSLAAEIESTLTDRTISDADAIRESILEYSWSKVASAVIEEYETILRPQYFDDHSWMSAEAEVSCG